MEYDSQSGFKEKFTQNPVVASVLETIVKPCIDDFSIANNRRAELIEKNVSGELSESQGVEYESLDNMSEEMDDFLFGSCYKEGMKGIEKIHSE